MSADLLQTRAPTSPQESSASRRVLLLETDERTGLVAAIADACHSHGVSIEITTGMSHVLLTFDAGGDVPDGAVQSLLRVPGVSAVHPYTVMALPPEIAAG